VPRCERGMPVAGGDVSPRAEKKRAGSPPSLVNESGAGRPLFAGLPDVVEAQRHVATGTIPGGSGGSGGHHVTAIGEVGRAHAHAGAFERAESASEIVADAGVEERVVGDVDGVGV